MSKSTFRSNRSETTSDEKVTTSVDDLLEAVSKELDPAQSEDFSELGIYSIHDHGSARTITLPKGADEFHDASTVKQYYFEGEDFPLLIVAPLNT